MAPRLICALDYGTSNSGAAYTLRDDDADNNGEIHINVICPWAQARSSRKVPSDIVYDEAGQAIGCGFDIPQHGRRLQWVKPLLEPSGLPTGLTRKTERIWNAFHALSPQELAKTPEGVVTDYLKWLWKEVEVYIQDEEDGLQISKISDLTVVLTVPASWSERAKYSMHRAAKGAGIPERAIKLIAEPEAAAIYSLKSLASRRKLDKDDCFIVCDVGGGTVDVVAYQIHNRSPLSLDQVTGSHADFCGSVFVDAEFQNQLRSILGDQYNLLTAEAKERTETEFEEKIKPFYNPEKSRTFYVAVPGLGDDETRNIRNGRLELPEAVLRESFESIYSSIMALVDQQSDLLKEKRLEQKLRGILLVGGFSGSQYLHTRMKQEAIGDGDIKIWHDDDSSTAVVRGAVACEASGSPSVATVHTRLSPYNFGIPYRSGNQRRVQWLVRKGQPVQTDTTTEPYVLRMDNEDWLDEDTHCHLIVPLVRSDEDNANDDYGPRVIPHAEIDCRVPTSLRENPEARLIESATPRKAWHIPATLALVLDGAVVSFSCRVLGQNVGVADVAYYGDTPEMDLARSSVSSAPSLIAPADSISSAESEDIATQTPAIAPASMTSSKKSTSITAKLRAGSFSLGIRTKRDPDKNKPKTVQTMTMDPCARLMR